MKKASKKFIVLNEVDSTNNYAKQLLLSKADEATVVLAQFQNAGKGQQGNRWESESGKNMLASIILYPYFLPAEKQFLISKVVSLALVDFLKTKVEQVAIKWPNDIYIGNKKIAGILIENTISGSNLQSVIVGIGLNLNQENFVSEAPNPLSLKQITGLNYDAEIVAAEVLQSILNWYEKLKIGDFEAINSAYISTLFRMNKWAKYKKDENLFEARIVEIGEFGQLQLEMYDGSVQEYLFKEVEFVL